MAMLLSMSLLLCAAASLSGAKEPESDPCFMEGWSVYGSRLYKFNSNKTTWSEAERACVLKGGNMASVHSIGEYRFLQSLIRKTTGSNPLTWIGGCDAAQEGIWLWSDGSIFSYTKWIQPIQPDNWRGKEHCIHMNHGGSKNWNDIKCSRKFASVCSQRL